MNKISRTDFFKINEDDVMFITNPGRMGDEDGSTFIIKKDNELIMYRIEGWIYPKPNEKEEYKISLKEMATQFPKWYETWKKGDEGYTDGKYKFHYMGFGNGLCIDYSIYDEYKPYLEKAADEYLKKYDYKNELKYAAIYKNWKKALTNMINDKKYIIK